MAAINNYAKEDSCMEWGPARQLRRSLPDLVFSANRSAKLTFTTPVLSCVRLGVKRRLCCVACPVRYLDKFNIFQLLDCLYPSAEL